MRPPLGSAARAHHRALAHEAAVLGARMRGGVQRQPRGLALLRALLRRAADAAHVVRRAAHRACARAIVQRRGARAGLGLGSRRSTCGTPRRAPSLRARPSRGIAARGALPATRSLLQPAGAAHCWGSAVRVARALALRWQTKPRDASGPMVCATLLTADHAHGARSERAQRSNLNAINMIRLFHWQQILGCSGRARTAAELGGGGGGAHDAPVRARAVHRPGQRARLQRVRAAVHRLPARPGPS